MTLESFAPVLGACVVLGAVLANRRLNRAAQSARLEIVQLSGKLLARKDLHDETRAQVERAGRALFGMMGLLCLLAIVIPFIAIGLLFNRKLRAELETPLPCPNEAVRHDVDRLQALSFTVMACNNPILTLLVSLEMGIFIAPAMIIGSLVLADPPRQVNRDSLFNVIEHRGVSSPAMLA